MRPWLMPRARALWTTRARPRRSGPAAHHPAARPRPAARRRSHCSSHWWRNPRLRRTPRPARLPRSAMRARDLAAAFGLMLLGAASIAGAQAGPQSLVDLIRDGNREAVLAAITSPAVDVNATEPDGSTALMWATYKVDHELVRALLKAGAKANVTNHYGSSPLAEAAKLADLDLVRMLLDAHAD